MSLWPGDAWQGAWGHAWAGSWGLTYEAGQELLTGSGGPDGPVAARAGRPRDDDEKLQLEHLEREREHKARLYSPEPTPVDSSPAGIAPATLPPPADSPPRAAVAPFIRVTTEELTLAANEAGALLEQIAALKLRRDEEEALLLILAEAA